MATLLQAARSLGFVLQMYLMMVIFGVLFAPFAAVSKSGARVACKTYARWVLWTARWMVGIRTEIRGEIPGGEVIIAAKHQSFLDILIIFEAVSQAKFIMKRALFWTPFIGLYAKRLGCISVDRTRGGAALIRMVKDVAAEFTDPGQLIIYPQGTRVAPGAYESYKVGSSVLYDGLKFQCIPAATNVGLFWPRRGIMRRQGLAVVAFLDPIAPGLKPRAFLAEVEDRIETASDALMREAGFDIDDNRHKH